jgi:hypothetical protein
MQAVYGNSVGVLATQYRSIRTPSSTSRLNPRPSAAAIGEEFCAGGAVAIARQPTDVEAALAEFKAVRGVWTGAERLAKVKTFHKNTFPITFTSFVS